MDRRAKACDGLDVARGLGLEFGPLASPIVRRSDGQVLYADHATREELQNKYSGHGWDVATIVDVDIHLSMMSLHEGLSDRKLDYVIASHVFEHIPDRLAGCMRSRPN